MLFCVQAQADALRLEREEERRDGMRLMMAAARPVLPLYANVGEEEVIKIPPFYVLKLFDNPGIK